MQPGMKIKVSEKLFGTDGIRAKAGQFPLDAVTVFRIGASLADQFAERLGRKPSFVIGRDTRESGQSILAAFYSGATSRGAKCESAGIITTPGVAFIAGRYEFDAGVVISASHNPFADNGIKIFSPCGRKMDDETERRIEEDIFSGSYIAGTEEEITHPAGDRTKRREEFQDAYRDHLKEFFINGYDLSGVKIVLDCANGAASAYAPGLLRDLGADVIAINDEPNGRNINKDCGSLHLEDLRQKVVETSANIGIAFDGDADRALFVDEKGEVVDGDGTLWILANYLVSKGKLSNRKVVATVMSNIGLEIALGNIGVGLIRANVGDKYVLESLLETDSELGGEQSGHIIVPENGLVGDGMMTMLFVLKAMREAARTLSAMAAEFVSFPQVLVNVDVSRKTPFDEVDAIACEKALLEEELTGKGRLLLRYSGTENLARVMIEGQDEDVISHQATRLAQVIAAELGGSIR